MSKAEQELSVFREFVTASSLSIISESIEKRDPPEPDIFCTLTDGNTLAVELVEIIDRSMMKRTSDKFELENELKRAYDASPVDRLDDAGVTIAFTNDSSSQRRKSSIKPIIEALASLPG
jgi:hypothetical protein